MANVIKSPSGFVQDPLNVEFRAKKRGTLKKVPLKYLSKKSVRLSSP